MRDAAPVVGRGEILLRRELAAAKHVPQPEFGTQPAIALPRDPAGDEPLRVDRTPVRKARLGVEIGDLLDIGSRVDRLKQPGAAQIIGDHLRHAARDFGIARRTGDEIRDRHRDRLDVAFIDAQAKLRRSGPRKHRAGRRCRAERKQTPAREPEGPKRAVCRHNILRSQT